MFEKAPAQTRYQPWSAIAHLLGTCQKACSAGTVGMVIMYGAQNGQGRFGVTFHFAVQMQNVHAIALRLVKQMARIRHITQAWQSGIHCLLRLAFPAFLRCHIVKRDFVPLRRLLLAELANIRCNAARIEHAPHKVPDTHTILPFSCSLLQARLFTLTGERELSIS